MGDRDAFVLTGEHLALLRRAYVRWDECEFGAPAIDCKRPYGSGDVIGDVLDIVGEERGVEDRRGERDWTKEQAERARVLHEDTETALQIVLATGAFAAGTYRRQERYDARSWQRVFD